MNDLVASSLPLILLNFPVNFRPPSLTRDKVGVELQIRQSLVLQIGRVFFRIELHIDDARAKATAWPVNISSDSRDMDLGMIGRKLHWTHMNTVGQIGHKGMRSEQHTS